MKKPIKKREPQKGQFFRPMPASLEKEKKSRIPVAFLRQRLAAAQVKIVSQPFLLKAEIGRVQGLERFEALSAGKDGAMIEALAMDYARIFNAGLVADSVGLETYYIKAGKETFCFANIKGIEKAPLIKMPKAKEDSLAARMKIFYETISMHDPEARKLFVNVFRKNLNSELQILFRSAMIHAYL